MKNTNYISTKKQFWKFNIPLHFLFIIIILFLLSIRVFLIFSYSIDLDGTEFGFVHNAQLLYKGISLYRNPDAFPFYAVIYNPLYYYFLYWCSLFFYINPVNEMHELLIAARSINLALMIFSLFLLYQILSKFELTKNYIFLLLICFMLLITGHFYVVRPDGFKITFFIAQFYAILQYFYFNKQNKRYLAIIIFCNTLSFLLKQDSIIYTGTCLFILWLCKKNKASFYLLAACFVSVIISYGICILLLGKYIFTCTFTYNFQVITDFRNSYNIIIIISSLARLSLPLLICIYTMWFVRKRINKDAVELFLAVCIVALLFISHLFMLKSGAYINYSFELIVVLIILTGKLITDFTSSIFMREAAIPVFFFYTLFICLTNISLTNYSLRKERLHPYKTYYHEHLTASKEIKTIVKTDVCFLPNCSNLVYFADYPNLFYGHDVHIDRFINLYLHIPVKSKLLLASSEKVDACFLNGTVKYIVIENDSVSQAHVKEYYPKYTFLKSVQKFVIYKFDTTKNTTLNVSDSI